MKLGHLSVEINKEKVLVEPSPDTVKLREGSFTALQQGHGGRAGPGAAGGGRPLR